MFEGAAPQPKRRADGPPARHPGTYAGSGRHLNQKSRATCALRVYHRSPHLSPPPVLLSPPPFRHARPGCRTSTTYPRWILSQNGYGLRMPHHAARHAATRLHKAPQGPPKEELPEYLLPRNVPMNQLELPPKRQGDFQLPSPRHRGRPQNTHLGLGAGAGAKIHIRKGCALCRRPRKNKLPSSSSSRSSSSSSSTSTSTST